VASFGLTAARFWGAILRPGVFIFVVAFVFLRADLAAALAFAGVSVLDVTRVFGWALILAVALVFAFTFGLIDVLVATLAAARPAVPILFFAAFFTAAFFFGVRGTFLWSGVLSSGRISSG